MMNNFWSPGMKLADVEKEAILLAYRFFRGNKTKTAEALDIAVRTLDNKLEQYEKQGVNVESIKAESRVRMEPIVELSTKSPLSMRKPEEVQEVSPAEPSKGNTGKGKRNSKQAEQ